MERVNISLIVFVVLLLSFIVVIPEGLSEDIKLFLISMTIILPTLYFRNLYKKMDDLVFKIERIPLMDVNEVTEGVPFSGEGVVEAENTINSPHTNTPCVYYHYVIEEYRRTGKSSTWTVTKNEVNYVPFYIKDRRGNRIKVEPKGIDKDMSEFSFPISSKYFAQKQYYSEIDGTYTVRYKSLQTGFLESKKRASEYVLKPGQKVYVIGMVKKNENGEMVVVEDNDWPLIISLKTKDEYIDEFRKGESVLFWSHIILSIGYTLFIISLISFGILNLLLFVPAFLIGNGFILGSTLFTTYNRIIELEERCKNALSTVEIELKRRAELIPQLVNVVKGYKEYESTVQKLLTEVRTHVVLSSSESKGLNSVSSLIANIEKYPEIKASEQFKKLMTELTDTEERIAQTREFYNKTVLRYNNMISQFPTSLIALIAGKKKKDFLNFENM